MSLKQKIEKWFYLEDEEEMEYEPSTSTRPASQQAGPRIAEAEQKRQVEQQVRSQSTMQQQPKSMKPNLVSIESAKKTAEVFLTEPRVYADAQEIADQLLKKKAVIVNLQKVDTEQGWRLVDFLSGTVYAINGDIQRVGANIFLCTPENVEVDGEITDYLER